jgi:hypothetical protein
MLVKDVQENYGAGWVKTYRSLRRHWIWHEKPFTKGQAWIDILLDCNHEGKKVNIGNEIIYCDRGESINSLKTWAKLWGWNISKVRRFLKLLENDSMVVLKSTHNTTHLSVCNYETYQDRRNGSETNMKTIRNEGETKVATNKKYKNVKNDKNKNNISFEIFWDGYDKKIDRPKCESKWNKLDEETQLKILKHVQLYKASQPDKKFRKNPATYLNNKAWENEIIRDNGNGKFKPSITEDELKKFSQSVLDDDRYE